MFQIWDLIYHKAPQMTDLYLHTKTWNEIRHWVGLQNLNKWGLGLILHSTYFLVKFYRNGTALIFTSAADALVY